MVCEWQKIVIARLPLMAVVTWFAATWLLPYQFSDELAGCGGRRSG